MTPETQKRAYALDALRGFAILAMILSGTIAYGILPAWMYHAQVPPPDHVFNRNLPGLTWVDLVFPLFLFSMGAAIPLALSNRIIKGWTYSKIILSIFKRGFLLAAFAIILQHFRPQVINPNQGGMEKWQMALLGFILLFFMFVRLPVSWKAGSRNLISLTAWFVAIVLLVSLRYPDGSGFSLSRSDIILVILANMAVFGSIIWLLTQNNLYLRAGLLALLFALQLSATGDNWIAKIWDYSPAPWIFRFDYLKYLFLIIPGTIVGDLIWHWLENVAENEAEYAWSIKRFRGIFWLMVTIVITLLIGLQARLVEQTIFAIAGFCLIGWFFFTQPNNATEKLLHHLYSWGCFWIALGLFFEPYQGGIKKDPSTISYYFITAAISIFILIILTLLVEIFQQSWGLQLLIDNGQNPMVGYVGFANLLWPILNLTGLETIIIANTKTPWLGFFKGVAYTLIVGLIVSFITRLKLFWRT